MSLFKRIFQRFFKPKKNGTTFAQAQSLYSGHFPSYLQLGTRYRVIERTYHGVHFPGDPSYEYMIQEKGPLGGSGPVFFVESPFKLPDVFWVRGLLAYRIDYEILPEGYDGEPLQIQLVRQEESNLLTA